MSKKDSFKNLFGKVEEDIKGQITIKEEFKNLIPPLAEEEFLQLEANILSEGCREPVIVWQNEKEYILIDGHNRYTICQKHGLSFRYEIKQFALEEDAKLWMINNQLGRRNLTPAQQSYLRGKRYETEKQQKGGYDKVLSKGQNVPLIVEELQDTSKGQNVPLTSERLGNEYGVSEKTIKRDAEYAKGLDKIGESNQTLKQAILSGKINIDKGKVRALGKISEKVVIDTEQDIDSIIANKQPSKQSSKPTIAQMREVLENAGSKVIIEIKGDFLIENNLAVYWQELRQFKKPITADFTDYITWGQAKIIGLVK
jgi:ParB-like nuclease domain